jgi:hypothetical protein
LPKTPWFKQIDYKDGLAVVGLGGLGYGFYRLGGPTLAIFYCAFIALAFSGLVNLCVHYVASFRAPKE